MKRTRLALPITVAIATLALAGPAAAHVTVVATNATPGASDVEITFRVPNEMPTARTTKLAVQFPLDTPIADVLVQPNPGWVFTTRTAVLAKPIVTDDGTIDDAVSQITWTATGRGITANEFGAFTVIAGQLPDAHTLTFKAVQTYSNGKVVSWIEQPAPGSSAEPEHPAPTLTLAAADPPPSSASNSTSGDALAMIALVIAGVGVVVAGAAYARARVSA